MDYAAYSQLLFLYLLEARADSTNPNCNIGELFSRNRNRENYRKEKDELFKDTNHLNEQGARLFTKIAIEDLNNLKLLNDFGKVGK